MKRLISRIKWMLTSKKRKQEIIAQSIAALQPFHSVSKETVRSIEFLQKWLPENLLKAFNGE